jgi:SAM-dependent methyltransferase
MSFDVSADAYGRFMGRFSKPLAAVFADWVGVRAGQTALDVGCGPGMLTAELEQRLGAAAVAAIDPSPSFVAATRALLPEVDVRLGVAERLPFPDDRFDVCLAQLVVHFMADPVAGLSEMARVTRGGGTVAAAVWDHAGGSGPLAAFWDAVHDLDPGAPGEAALAGTGEGQLAELCRAAGLRAVEASALTVRVAFDTFGDWWEPFTLGVGPAGGHVAALDERGRAALRDRCATQLPSPPFDVSASAWCARGVA